MKRQGKYITVFEHQSLKLNQEFPEGSFDGNCLKALQLHYGEKGVPYYTLINNGVKFNEYVGVIQVGNIIIEVLPKADKNETDKNKWRDLLIGMLRATGNLEIKNTGESHLKIKRNSILELYFEMFIKEVEYLLHSGLIKQYRKKEGNVSALKGSLLFAKQIQQNLMHQERFYVRHTSYDVEHTLHFILYKTIKLLHQINSNAALHSRIGALLLHFPEMPDIKVTEATFNKIVYHRKNQSYQKSIAIAKLLLLHYHPDISKGQHHVLALMFDMNLLWEQFVYASLRKYKQVGDSLASQPLKLFWRADQGKYTSMKPDIVINKDKVQCIVLDTKWKNLNGNNPTPDDLRQMYVYHAYFAAKKVALVYPGLLNNISSGAYEKTVDKDDRDEKKCSVITLAVEPKIKSWQYTICKELMDWMDIGHIQSQKSVQ